MKNEDNWRSRYTWTKANDWFLTKFFSPSASPSLPIYTWNFQLKLVSTTHKFGCLPDPLLPTSTFSWLGCCRCCLRMMIHLGWDVAGAIPKGGPKITDVGKMEKMKVLMLMNHWWKWPGKEGVIGVEKERE